MTSVCPFVMRAVGHAPLIRLWRVGARSARSGDTTVVRDDGRPTLIEGASYAYELGPAEGVGTLAATVEPEELFEPDRPGASRGRLRLNSRAGVLVIGVTPAGGPPCSAVVDVASAKLQYDNEFRWMLRDITSELSEAAVARFAPTQGPYTSKEDGDAITLYQRFAFLQAVLQSNDYHAALQQLLADPYVAWIGAARTRETARGLIASHASIRALVTVGPGYRLPSPNWNAFAACHARCQSNDWRQQ